MKRFFWGFLVPIIALAFLYWYFLSPSSFINETFLITFERASGKPAIYLPLHFLVDGAIFTLAYILVFPVAYQTYFKGDQPFYIKGMHFYQIIRLLLTIGMSVYIGLNIAIYKEQIAQVATEGFNYLNYIFILRMALMVAMPLFSIFNFICENSCDCYSILRILIVYFFTALCIVFVMFYGANRKTEAMRGWFWICSLFSLIYLFGRFAIIIFGIGGEGSNFFSCDDDSGMTIAKIIFSVILASVLVFAVVKAIQTPTFFTVALRIFEVIFAIGCPIAAIAGGGSGGEITIWIVAVS